MPQDNQRVFNPKTPLEYVLGLLEEEAGEVIQAVTGERAARGRSGYCRRSRYCRIP